MKFAAWGLLGLTAAFLVAPLLVVTAYSFNSVEASAELKGVSLEWYGRAFARSDFRQYLFNTLWVATLTTVVSGLVGVSGALAAHFTPSPSTRRVLTALCIVPILTPELLMALGLSYFLDAVGIQRSLLTVALGHTSFGVPLFFVLTDAALGGGRFDDLIRAARDLGASGGHAVRRVVLPLLWPYVLSSAILIWALSVDEFVLSYFLSGPDSQVLTVRLYSLIRTRGLSTEINVACVVLMLMVVSVWLAGWAVRKRRETA